MTNKLESVLDLALELNDSERAFIAHSLINSIDGPPDDDVEAAWMDLALKRKAEIESGAVKPVSWESVKKRIKAKYA